jgi:hypothetical protein
MHSTPNRKIGHEKAKRAHTTIVRGWEELPVST